MNARFQSALHCRDIDDASIAHAWTSCVEAVARAVRYALAAALLACALTVPAYALMITAGQVLILAYDFTRQSPPPPYDTVMTYVELHPLTQTAIPGYVLLSLFSDLDGKGQLLDGGLIDITGHLTLVVPTTPSVVDGTLSIVMTAFVSPYGDYGPVDVYSYAEAWDAEGRTLVHLDPHVVSEPAGLVLIALALGGLAMTLPRSRPR